MGQRPHQASGKGNSPHCTYLLDMQQKSISLKLHTLPASLVAPKPPISLIIPHGETGREHNLLPIPPWLKRGHVEWEFLQVLAEMIYMELHAKG